MKISESPLFWISGIVLTAILGTWLRSRENRNAQRIKDLRSKIDGIFEDLDNIEELAFKYFLKSGNDSDVAEDALKIKAKLKRVALRVNAIHKNTSLRRPSSGSSSLTKLMNFRRAVTLEDFDSADRQPWLSKDVRFEKISTSSSELKNILEAVYDSN